MGATRSNMLRLIHSYCRVVETGSICVAADQLGTNRDAIHQAILTLESETQLTLLNRETPHISLTEAGRQFYRGCCDVLGSVVRLDELTGQLTGHNDTQLRVACSSLLSSTVLVPTLERFIASNPRLKIELVIKDDLNTVDDEAVDVTVRAGWPGDSSQVACKLFDSAQFICAAPSYLEKAGKPASAQALSQHNWLSLTQHKILNILNLTDTEGKEQSITLNGSISTDSSSTLHSLLLNGYGITTLPACTIQTELNNGSLRRLLPEYLLEPIGIYALYPSRAHTPEKIRKFVRHLQSCFSPTR